MTEPPATPQPQGCLGALVAVALVALLLTLGMSPPMTPSIYAFVFPITAIAFTLVGLPLYALARWLNRANLGTALAAGVTTGAAFPLLSVLSSQGSDAWPAVAAYAVAGAVGGLAFFLAATLRQAPRRNTLLLVAVTALAIAATLGTRTAF